MCRADQPRQLRLQVRSEFRNTDGRKRCASGAMHIAADGRAAILIVTAAMLPRHGLRRHCGRRRCAHADRHEHKREQRHQTKNERRHTLDIGLVAFRGNEAGHIPNHMRDIHSAMAIIMRFSVSETKPSGTLLDPPTQAHFSSRLST